jgi:predicted nucleic acid-binding protein
MPTPFLDSNIFLRHLLNDDSAKAAQCLALFRAIENRTITVWTTPLVIAEVVFVLASKRTYNVERTRIRDLLLPLINLPGLKIPQKRVYDRVFALYTALPIDYIDCYHAALMERQGNRQLYSYDTDFDRVSLIHRIEP